MHGNSQTFGCFLEKVQAVFYELTGSEAEIPIKLAQSGIYNNLLNIRKSKSNDFDAFKAALDQFEKITPTRKAFPYKEQMKGSSQSSGSKRSRNPNATSQQSDGRLHFDINNDPLDLEDEQPLRRPVGRNKAKTKRLHWLRDLVNVDGDVESGRTKNDRNIIDDSNKNRYENLENKSGQSRRRRFGAISRDEGVRSSPT
uniref:Uncharacterized protein n=1 Tax=Lactuca sativa TaxID=4236 RepID=A0A9R1VHU3_LACSA|nr:hypothetical protein LSAT_V11C500235650 [Lactuca sativa]